jgi:DNA replication ATP-dependent helicase Dna2
MGARERELCGRCIGDLSLTACDPVCAADASAFAGFVCRFERPAIGDVLQRSQLAEGDPIVVSSMERGHFGLAIGFLSALREDGAALSVVVDRPLEIGGPGGRFRVDKDELSASFGLLRTNLLKLFAPEQARLMRLVVQLEAPQFGCIKDVPIPGHLLEAYAGLDACQREVVRRAMATEDYLLVLGMPGTGKSTTLALLIRLLIARGKSILLTSHTHSAVDNILLKLTGDMRFCRLGNPEKIPPGLHHSVFERQRFHSLAQLESFFMGAPLVACTTLAVNKALLGKRTFDVCIVDEASQISVPACVGPLRFARAFLLVGDHYQLPPLVRSKQAAAEGLQRSLFALLADAHPQAVAMLRLQYRMNADIMAISNRFVYADMLACGSEAVANARMHLPKLRSFQCVLCGSGPSCWLRQVLDPARTVLFLNTDGIGAFEVASGNSFQNPAEAAIIHALLAALLSAGSAQEDLTVISPYRPQLKLLADPAAFPAVPVATVDKFQGRDAACVLISLVRSNPERRLGALLKDWSRLNVAFTRAKAKLVLVGSLATIASDEAMAGLCEMFRERHWIYPVPPDHADHHAIL